MIITEQTLAKFGFEKHHDQWVFDSIEFDLVISLWSIRNHVVASLFCGHVEQKVCIKNSIHLRNLIVSLTGQSDSITESALEFAGFIQQDDNDDSIWLLDGVSGGVEVVINSSGEIMIDQYTRDNRIVGYRYQEKVMKCENNMTNLLNYCLVNGYGNRLFV